MTKQRKVRSCMKATPPLRVNGRGQWVVGRRCGQATHLCGVLPLVSQAADAFVGLLVAPRRVLTPSPSPQPLRARCVVCWHLSAGAPRCGRMLPTWWSKLSSFRWHKVVLRGYDDERGWWIVVVEEQPVWRINITLFVTVVCDTRDINKVVRSSSDIPF